MEITYMKEKVLDLNFGLKFGKITWSPGGMISEIMEVPFPLASCRLLINFFTFQISTFLSEAVSSLILQKTRLVLTVL